MKDRVAKLEPSTLKQLEVAIKQVWSDLPQKFGSEFNFFNAKANGTGNSK